MSSNLVLTFPGGKRIQHTIPATAGNVAYNATPAVLKRWLILRGRITLVADANAANRYITLVLTDGTIVVEEMGQSTVIVATETRTVNFGGVRSVNNYTYPTMYVGINPMLIEGEDQFRISIVNGLAGDSFSGVLVAREL